MNSESGSLHDNSITVSVILPVYNVAPWIDDCIDSLKRQQLCGLEFIFIDDCSTDESLAIVEEFAAEDSRVRVIQNEKNLGAGPSRNRGIEAARGEYLSFVDPDDRISDDFYEIMYRKAKESGCDIVKAARLIAGENTPKRVSPSAVDADNELIERRALSGLPLYCVFMRAHHAAIFKTSLILNSDIRYGLSRVGEDSLFLLKVCTNTESIVTTDEPVYYYRRRSNSATSEFSFQRSLVQLSALQEVIDYLSSIDISDELKAEYLRRRLPYYISCYYYADSSESITHKDRENYYNSLVDMLSATGVLSSIKEDIPELEVFLNCKTIIPCYNVRKDVVFIDKMLEWIKFLGEHPESARANYYKACAESIIRYIHSIVSLRAKGSKSKSTGLRYVKQRFASLPVKTRLYVLRSIPPALLSMVYEKVAIRRLRND